MFNHHLICPTFPVSFLLLLFSRVNLYFNSPFLWNLNIYQFSVCRCGQLIKWPYKRSPQHTLECILFDNTHSVKLHRDALNRHRRKLANFAFHLEYSSGIPFVTSCCDSKVQLLLMKKATFNMILRRITYLCHQKRCRNFNEI